MTTIGDDRGASGADPTSASASPPSSDGERDEILLDGSGATATELQRARQTVTLLRGLLPRLHDDGDAARCAFDAGTLLGWPLDEPEEALDAMQLAYQRFPTSAAFARGYRKAAMRARDVREQMTALESEAKLTTSSSHRAELLAARSQLLGKGLDNAEAARFALAQSAQLESRAVVIEQLEKLAVDSGQAQGAADHAQRLAGLVTDVAVRAEHLARAARHLERADDLQGALVVAVQAQVHAPGSPAISFAVERLLARSGAHGELATLRERQLEQGLVPAVDAWFDAGIVARYRLDDAERAAQAFEAAVAAAGDDEDRARPALVQLAQVLERLGRHDQVIDVLERLATVADDEAARHWCRIAEIYEHDLDDPTHAADAYARALAADPSSMQAMAGRGRLLWLQDESHAREALARMHRGEAERSVAPESRGKALLRLGELLIAAPATIESGIAHLREALELLPGHLGVVTALERGLRAHGDDAGLAALYEHLLEDADSVDRQAALLAKLGFAADRQGHAARAKDAFRQHLELDTPQPALPLVRLAELLEDGSDDRTLIAALTRVVDQANDDVLRATALGRIAAAQERLGERDASLSTFEDALSLAADEPTHPVYAAAGRAFASAGHYDALLRVLLAGTQSGPNAERACWLVKAARVMDRHLDLTDDAIDALHSAAALDPRSHAHRALEAILIRLERWEDAVASFEERQDTCDDGGRLLAYAAIAEAVDDETALRLYARALEEGEPAAWLPLARLRALLGRWDELERMYGSEGTNMPELHARYRAGEIALERLNAPDRALAHFRAAHEAARGALAPLVALAPIVNDDEERVEVLSSLQAATQDRETRLSCSKRRIACMDALGRADEALQTRLDLLALAPSDPTVLLEVELELERRGDRVSLAEVLRNASADPHLDEDVRAAVRAQLGSVLEQLGLLRDAVDAYESAQREDAPPSRAVLLGLRRCYEALEDDRVGQVLAALAACPPAGPEQALCQRALAWWWMERGDVEAARAGVERALHTHPGDYEALNDLVEIAGETAPTTVSDAMSRAFGLETDGDRKRRLGLALAARLLRAERLEPAREVVTRLVDEYPDDLRVMMLLAEMQERRESWARAAATLDRIAQLASAPAAVRVEALLRLVAIHEQHLHDADAAEATTKRILALDEDGALGPELRVDVEEALGNHAAAAKTLETLASAPELSSSERAPHLLRLAAVHWHHLRDPRSALAALAKVTDANSRLEIERQLAAMAERDDDAEAVRDALRASLDAPLEPEWEASLHRRLGDVLHRHLESSEQAFGHFERAVALVPDDTASLQALAEIASARSNEQAIAFHRRLLAIEPLHEASYRALHQLFLRSDDTDGAFCAEAVLVGLNAATDEERYFYRQRRGASTKTLVAKLDDDELRLLFPQCDEPAFELLAALQPYLAEIIDTGGASLEAAIGDASSPITPVANAVSRLLGVASFEVSSVPKLPVARAELGAPPRVLVPSSLESALRREQQFVLGALLSRVAFGGIVTDPSSPSPPGSVERALRAAGELASGNAPKSDIARRLDGVLAGPARKRVIAAAERCATGSMPDEEAMTAAFRETSLRTATLCAQDPSVAIRCLRIHGPLFTKDALEGAIHPATSAALAFAVSAEHLRLRARLAGAVEERTP
jgi:tetratricopeptide (TPR) repeat protein